MWYIFMKLIILRKHFSFCFELIIFIFSLHILLNLINISKFFKCDKFLKFISRARLLNFEHDINRNHVIVT